MSGTMKAARIHEAGGALKIENIAIPEPGPGEVLVKLSASPINPSDLSTLDSGYLVKQWPLTPGLEGSGTVVSAGKGVLPALRKGKRVACSPRAGGDGCWAEYMCTSATRVSPLPSHISQEQGAMLLVNPMTALALISMAKKGRHHALVMNAGASALGKMMLSQCRLEGIPLISIVRKASQAEELKSLGAAFVLDSTQEGYQEELRKICLEQKATFLLDAVGGKESKRMLAAAPDTSTLVVYARLSGENISADPADLIRHGKSITGFQLGNWLKSKDLISKVKLVKQVKKHLDTTLASKIDSSYNLEEVREAVEHYRKNMSRGKILLLHHS